LNMACGESKSSGTSGLKSGARFFASVIVLLQP
jgi:hypothetical protein